MKEPSFSQVLLYTLAVNIYALGFAIGNKHDGFEHWAWVMGSWFVGLGLFAIALALPTKSKRQTNTKRRVS